MMDIEDIHPLRDLAKFDTIWPRLRCCRKSKCCRAEPNFKYGLRKTLLKELELHMPSSEEALNEDPFLILGYGINAYFEIISSLFWMMTVISIVFIPVLAVYADNTVNGLAQQPKAIINMWSLGNMGSSTVSCKSAPLAHERLSFSCPMGLIDVMHPSLGIMNTGLRTKVFCSEAAIWKDSNNVEPEVTCTSYIDRVRMYERIVRLCQG